MVQNVGRVLGGRLTFDIMHLFAKVDMTPRLIKELSKQPQPTTAAEVATWIDTVRAKMSRTMPTITTRNDILGVHNYALDGEMLADGPGVRIWKGVWFDPAKAYAPTPIVLKALRDHRAAVKEVENYAKLIERSGPSPCIVRVKVRQRILDVMVTSFYIADLPDHAPSLCRSSSNSIIWIPTTQPS